MKKPLTLLFLLMTTLHYSQNATEVYLFDFVKNDSTQFELKNPVNISSNKGFYDNQPSFLLDGTGVLFASTRNEQTDIALYNLENQTKAWLTNTVDSEYSPMQMPNKKYFSAVKLEKDGTQLLWQFNFNRKKSKPLINDLKVGYHTWFNKKMLITFVLGDPATLQASNLKVKVRYKLAKNIGRSIHKIPNTELISYINHENDDHEIYSINPINSEEKYITDAIEGSQDMAWTPDGTIIMGKGNTLYKFKPNVDKKWEAFASLKNFKLNGITRLAISPLGNKIALVVNEEKPKNETKNK